MCNQSWYAIHIWWKIISGYGTCYFRWCNYWSSLGNMRSINLSVRRNRRHVQIALGNWIIFPLDLAEFERSRIVWHNIQCVVQSVIHSYNCLCFAEISSCTGPKDKINACHLQVSHACFFVKPCQLSGKLVWKKHLNSTGR